MPLLGRLQYTVIQYMTEIAEMFTNVTCLYTCEWSCHLSNRLFMRSRLFYTAQLLTSARLFWTVRTCTSLGAGGLKWPGPKMHPKAISQLSNSYRGLIISAKPVGIINHKEWCNVFKALVCITEPLQAIKLWAKTPPNWDITFVQEMQWWYNGMTELLSTAKRGR